MSTASAVLAAVAASTGLTAAALAATYGGDGVSALEALLFVLILPLHAMLAAGFWFAVTGLVRSKSPPADGDARGPADGADGFTTAIAIPVFHEDADDVFRRIRTMYEDLRHSGRLERFEFFVLSDSFRPEMCEAEERAWQRVCGQVGGFGRIFYRRREDNSGKKAGNVAEFCRRFGGRYRYMIVLDADSLVRAHTMVELVRRMEADDRLGLLQTRPLEHEGRTLFARIRQFANSFYGRLFTWGIATVQGDAAFYWGHNAIVRMEAFAESCGLPELSGRPPWGGAILSHDFVEAALLRRRGWKVRIDPDLDGSFEEGPPTLIDFAKRDRRWCQGNLQHARLLTIRGLHWISRGSFVLGIMGYLSGPLWFLLLSATTAAALAGALPQRAPMADLPVGGDVAVLALTGLFLFGPKLMALGDGLLDGRTRRQHGGGLSLTASVLAEIVVSALLAPLMMLLHTRFVAEVLSGCTVSWNPQRRDTDRVRWREALAAHGPEMLGALGVAAAVAVLAPQQFWWLMPVLAGLILAVPLGVCLGSADLGGRAARLGLFRVPHEPRAAAPTAKPGGLAAETAPAGTE